MIPLSSQMVDKLVILLMSATYLTDIYYESPLGSPKNIARQQLFLLYEISIKLPVFPVMHALKS